VAEVNFFDKVLDAYKDEETDKDIQGLIDNKKELAPNKLPYKTSRKHYLYSGWKRKTMTGLSLCKDSTGTARDICAALSDEVPNNEKTFSRVSNALVQLRLDGSIIRLPKTHKMKYIFTIPTTQK